MDICRDTDIFTAIFFPGVVSIYMSGKVFIIVFGYGIKGFSLIPVDLKMGDIFMTIFLGGELIVSHSLIEDLDEI